MQQDGYLCRSLTYPERLKTLSLESLERRRLFFDLCYSYKLLTGKVHADENHFLKVDTNQRTRGHDMKLYKTFSAYNYRIQYFTTRVIDTWNKLPNDLVHAPTLSIFKNLLTCYFDRTDFI